MGRQGELDSNVIDKVEDTRLSGKVDDEWRPIAAIEDREGNLLGVGPVNDNRAKFKSHNETIPSGVVWTVDTTQILDVDGLTVEGTLWVDNQVINYGTLSGDGTVKGDGTITSRAA